MEQGQVWEMPSLSPLSSLVIRWIVIYPVDSAIQRWIKCIVTKNWRNRRIFLKSNMADGSLIQLGLLKSRTCSFNRPYVYLCIYGPCGAMSKSMSLLSEILYQ